MNETENRKINENGEHTILRWLIFSISISIIISQGFTLQRSLRTFSLLDGLWLFVLVLIVPIIFVIRGKTNQRALIFLKSLLISLFLLLYPAYTTPGDYMIEIFRISIKNSGSELQILILGIAILQALTVLGHEKLPKGSFESGILFGTLMAGINLFVVLFYGWTIYLVIPLVFYLLFLLYFAMNPSASIDFDSALKNEEALDPTNNPIGILGGLILVVFPFLYSAFSFDRVRYMAAYSVPLIYSGLLALILWILTCVPKIKEIKSNLESKRYYSLVLLIILALLNGLLLKRIWSKDNALVVDYFRSNEYFFVLFLLLVFGSLFISNLLSANKNSVENGEYLKIKRGKKVIKAFYPNLAVAALWQGSSMVFSWNSTETEPFLISISVIGFGFLLCIVSLIQIVLKSGKSKRYQE